MAGANIQFRPKGLGTEKRTRAGVRKAGQPSEGKLEEGRGGANWAEGWQEIFKRHIKRTYLRPSKVQTKRLGVHGLHCGGRRRRIEFQNHKPKRQMPTGLQAGSAKSPVWIAGRAGSRVDNRAWPAG